MKTIYVLTLWLCVIIAAFLSCSADRGIDPIATDARAIQPVCKLAAGLDVQDIDSAAAIVTGDNIADSAVFQLFVDRSSNPKKLYGTIELPPDGNNWTIAVELLDNQRRRIGMGTLQINDSYFSAGKYIAEVPIGIHSAKPHIDTIYVSDDSIGILDSIYLFSTARDSFGGEIVGYEWKIDSDLWAATDGDTVFIAPPDAGELVCSLRVTDDEGNVTTGSLGITVNTFAPVADAGEDTTIGANQPLSLHGRGTDETDVTGYEWKIGDDDDWIESDSGDTTIITPANSQTLVCSLRVTDDDGNQAVDEIFIFVNALALDAGADTTVGINDSVSLRGSAGVQDDVEIYEWKIGENGRWLESENGDTTIVAPSTAQAVLCSLRATDIYGNIESDAMVVTVETRAPTALAGTDTVVAVDKQLTLHGDGDDESTIVRYEWKIGDSQWIVTAGSDTTFTTPSTDQTIICSLRVTDDDGNQAVDELTVTVASLVARAWPDTTVGINDTINLRGESIGENEIIRYEWKPGDNDWVTTSKIDTAIFAPPTEQIYPCSLRVTDNVGNVASDEMIVMVETRKPEVQAAADTSVGVNDSVYLYAREAVDETNIVEFAWKLGNDGEWIITSAADTIIFAPQTAQEYPCSLKITDDDGNIAVDGMAITVERRAPVLELRPDTIVGINDEISLYAIMADDETGIVTYEWKIGDGEWIVTSSDDTTIIAPATARTLNCSLRVTDNDGNIAADGINVTVESFPPTVELGDDTIAIVTNSIHLFADAEDETRIALYEWKFGTAGIWTEGSEDTTIVPLTIGARICSVRVTDDDGNRTVDGKTIMVNMGTLTLDDFSDQDEFNAFGQKWYYYDDNFGVLKYDRPQAADPALAPTVIDVPYTESPRHASGDITDTYPIKNYEFTTSSDNEGFFATMPFTMGEKWLFVEDSYSFHVYPYCAIGTRLAPDGESMDLSGVQSIEFRIRSQQTDTIHFKVQIQALEEYSDIELGGDQEGEGGYHMTKLATTAGEWVAFTVPIENLVQPPWVNTGAEMPFDITQVTAFVWEVQANNEGMVDTIDIDDVILRME